MKSAKLTCITALALIAALTISVQLSAQQKPPKHHKYQLTDLGTLGGPESLFGTFLAQVLNNKGQFVGMADINKLDPYFPNCFNPPSCYALHATRWDNNGSPIDLGTLPGGVSSSPNWINSNGVSVGGSQNGVIDPLTGFPEGRAVRWDKTGIHRLGGLGGNESFAIGENDNDWIVGAAANKIPDDNSFFGWGTQTRAFLWKPGKGMTDLGTLGGTDAVAGQINQSGQIAGASYTAAGATEPFIWENKKMISLGTLGGTSGGPNYMNNNGQVIGQSNLAGNAFTHGFFWDKNTGMRDLGTLGGTFVNPTELNDAAQVVGVSRLSGDQLSHAFLWQAGVMTDLGTVKGDLCSVAWAINSQGQVVGDSRPHCGPTVHASLWENGGPMVDLNTLIQIPLNPRVQLTYAAAINDVGQIACLGIVNVPGTASVLLHAFLLTPLADGEMDNPASASEEDSSTVPSTPEEIKRYRFAGIRPID